MKESKEDINSGLGRNEITVVEELLRERKKEGEKKTEQEKLDIHLKGQRAKDDNFFFTK